MILQCVSSCQRVQTIGSWTSPVMLATPLYLLQKRYLTPTLSRQTCHPVGFISDHARAEGVSNVTAQPADAQDLEQFHDCTFAAVTCSYGLMLMPDHARALREAYRVLQPGGIYVATVWAPLETFQFGQMFVEVVKELAGDTPLPSSPYTPWRFGNPLQLLQDLKAANFSDVECTAYSHAMTFTLPDLIEFQLGPHGQSRPTLDRLTALGRDNIDEEAQKVMRNVLEQQGRLHEGKAHFENTALLFTAVKHKLRSTDLDLNKR